MGLLQLKRQCFSVKHFLERSTAVNEILKQYHSVPYAKGFDEKQPFTLICPWIRKTPVCETTSMSSSSPSYEILRPGMIILRNYINLENQVNIVNICEKWAGGFNKPGCQNGADLRRLMCFGRNWDPETMYEKRDGPGPPPVPHELISLAETAIQDAQTLVDELPSMCPDTCLVSFYPPNGRLGLHQEVLCCVSTKGMVVEIARRSEDRDESSDSLSKGLPVVSISIGDTAYFIYGDTRDENNLDRVLLHSGDVLIFGGKSRLVYHGVKLIFPNSSPKPLLIASGVRIGRLNLTLRQF